MSEKREYWAAGDGFIDGTWRSVGEVVLMTPAQARYHRLVGRLSHTAPVPARLEKKNGAASGDGSKDGKTAD